MAEFHSLIVTDLARDTADAVVFTLRPPAELADRLAHRPGKYLTYTRLGRRRTPPVLSNLRQPAGQPPARRHQTSVGRWLLKLGHEGLKVGDRLAAMIRAGRFTVTPEPTAAKTYLGLAAGSGITPGSAL